MATQENREPGSPKFYDIGLLDHLGHQKSSGQLQIFCTCAVNDGPHNLLSDCWPPAFLMLVWCNFFEIVTQKSIHEKFCCLKVQ